VTFALDHRDTFELDLVEHEKQGGRLILNARSNRKTV